MSKNNDPILLNATHDVVAARDALAVIGITSAVSSDPVDADLLMQECKRVAKVIRMVQQDQDKRS